MINFIRYSGGFIVAVLVLVLWSVFKKILSEAALIRLLEKRSATAASVRLVAQRRKSVRLDWFVATVLILILSWIVFVSVWIG